MIKPHSGGSTPARTGTKRSAYERNTNTQMRAALDKALKRLGDPVTDYRVGRDRIVKARARRKTNG